MLPYSILEHRKDTIFIKVFYYNYTKSKKLEMTYKEFKEWKKINRGKEV